ncbi:peptide deformylase [Halobacteriovorax sp.]|uniref:peptide deformylase n=1 Tax=Halobacteriovorax sp. TaxID=2020862 RepID=UPI0035670EE9
MAIKELTRMGNPVLRKVATEYDLSEIGSQSFLGLIEDLVDTMNENGGIGIAAPQIGVSTQVAIIKIPSDSERYPETDASELFIIINPVIEVIDSEAQGFWEGCLSVPGLRGYVERPRKVKVTYFDEDSNKKEITLEGFLATVFQHELDHLFGKLYIDRISDLTKLSYEDEYINYWVESPN